MKPDAYTKLQIVNCTSQSLYSGTGGEGFFHLYQMESWFSYPNAPSPLVKSRETASFFLQFQSGVGDQDDGADIQIDVGNGNKPANNIVWLQGRTTNKSVHYNQAVVQRPVLPNMGPFAIATTERGTWPRETPDGLNWFAYKQTAPLPAYNDDQCLAIVDLSTFLPRAVAEIIWATIAAGKKLGPNDRESLWLGVNHYMHWD
jgi:hypothetical protein